MEHSTSQLSLQFFSECRPPFPAISTGWQSANDARKSFDAFFDEATLLCALQLHSCHWVILKAMAKEAIIRISKRYRKPCDRDNDFLSKLPDDLLICILSFLRTKDAIQTSILSKRWRHLWRYVYNVDFYYIEPLKRFRPPVTCKYATFHNFLTNFSQSRIRSFNVQVQHRCQSTINTFHLDLWVKWAIEHGVEMLVLKINETANGIFYRVPPILSECKTLVDLKLSNSFLSSSSETSFLWPLLKCLSLKKVFLYALNFNNIMCYCPSLERVSLVSCEFGTSNKQRSAIRICSPTLRYLQLWDCKHKECKITINLPSLVEVSINMLLYRNGAEQRGVLAAVSFVKKLHVGVRCTKALSVKSFNASTSFRHVEVEIGLNNLRYLKGMVNLMSCSSNLQTLVIKFQSDRRDGKCGGMTCGKALEEHLSKRVLHLRTLHVHGIYLYDLITLFKENNNGPKIDTNLTINTMKIDVVKFLLERLDYLEKLVIYVVPSYAEDLISHRSYLLEEVTKSLQQFERASPFVHILVSWDHPKQ